MSKLGTILYNTITHHCCPLCGVPILWESTSLCDTCFTQLPILQEKHNCRRCGLPLLGEQDICMRCRSIDSPVQRKNSPLFSYRGVGKTLIEEYKFGCNRLLAYTFAEILYGNRLAQKTGYTVIPVPASHKSVKKRGWDQVEEICKILWDQYGIPYSQNIHRKSADKREQKTLDREERQVHSNNIYFLAKRCYYDRVILLDDVSTTGASIDTCYTILKKQGVSQIYTCTLAQV